jgi:hypothetical protein
MDQENVLGRGWISRPTAGTERQNAGEAADAGGRLNRFHRVVLESVSFAPAAAHLRRTTTCSIRERSGSICKLAVKGEGAGRPRRIGADRSTRRLGGRSHAPGDTTISRAAKRAMHESLGVGTMLTVETPARKCGGQTSSFTLTFAVDAGIGRHHSVSDVWVAG